MTTYDAQYGYTAAIGTAPDVVSAGSCDVMVLENVFAGEREDEDGNTITETGLGDTAAMEAVDLGVPTGHDDAGTLAIEAAGEILAANGWRVTGRWDVADTAMYAPVERA